MGCDIHLYVEVRKDGEWTPAADPVPYRYGDPESKEMEWPSPYRDRSYDVFGILANVRNGSGFAGIETGDGWPFMSEPRGLPDDICTQYRTANESEDGARLWFGDHSFSHLTLREILAFDRSQSSYICGIVRWSTWVRWIYINNYTGKMNYAPKDTTPDGWSGGVSGPGIVIHESDAEFRKRYEAMTPVERRDIAYSERAKDTMNSEDKELCRFRVERSVGEALKFFDIAVTVPLVSRAVRESVELDDIRIVFGFDS